MEFKDYYKIMGIARDATEAQIKTAYRKLARKYHPDVSKEKDAEARFKDLGEAYEVLKNPEKRAAYDQLGQGPRPGEQFRPPPDWGTGFEFSGADGNDTDHSDFFESLFGRQGRARSRPGFAGGGQDNHARILLDLDASLQGGQRTFTLRVPALDADGHLETKERTLKRPDSEGRFGGPDDPPTGPRVAGDRTRTCRRSLYRSRISAAPALPRRRPGFAAHGAARALGSEPRRKRRNSDARRRRAAENSAGIPRRQQAAAARPRDPRDARRRSVRSARDRAAAGH